MEFGTAVEMRKVARLAQEFFTEILYDEEPLFTSDEATIFDVSMTPPEELLRRCSQYYKKSVTRDDLKHPFWKLLLQLNEGRNDYP
jgi:hypothetical protein